MHRQLTENAFLLHLLYNNRVGQWCNSPSGVGTGAEGCGTGAGASGTGLGASRTGVGAWSAGTGVGAPSGEGAGAGAKRGLGSRLGPAKQEKDCWPCWSATGGADALKADGVLSADASQDCLFWQVFMLGWRQEGGHGRHPAMEQALALELEPGFGALERVQGQELEGLALFQQDLEQWGQVQEPVVETVSTEVDLEH